MGRRCNADTTPQIAMLSPSVVLKQQIKGGTQRCAPYMLHRAVKPFGQSKSLLLIKQMFVALVSQGLEKCNKGINAPVVEGWGLLEFR